MISPWKVQLGRENGPFSPKRKVQIANPTSFLAQKILIHEDRVRESNKTLFEHVAVPGWRVPAQVFSS